MTLFSFSLMIINCFFQFNLKFAVVLVYSTGKNVRSLGLLFSTKFT
jgi:hypothetical protein